MGLGGAEEEEEEEEASGEDGEARKLLLNLSPGVCCPALFNVGEIVEIRREALLADVSEKLLALLSLMTKISSLCFSSSSLSELSLSVSEWDGMMFTIRRTELD